MKTKTQNQDFQEIDIKEMLSDRFGAEQVEKWQKEYLGRKLNVIVVEDKIGVLRPVTAKEVSEYSMILADPEMGIDKACSYLLAELWLGGDNELKDDEECFISTMLQIQQVMQLKKSNFYRL